MKEITNMYKTQLHIFQNFQVTLSAELKIATDVRYHKKETFLFGMLLPILIFHGGI